MLRHRNRLALGCLCAVLAACSGSTDKPAITGPATKPDTPAPPPPPPDPVILGTSKFLLLTGEKFDLASGTSNPSGAALTWASSDTTVAVVSNGLVTGRKFGVASISVMPAGGTSTEAKVWVANPTASFGSVIDGCPSPAETLFVSAAIPHIDTSGDSSAVCSPTPGTVALQLTKARAIRILVAAAGIKFGPMPWAPTSRSLFEWFAFDSKLLGIHFTPLANATGECCENLPTPEGLKFGIILMDSKFVGRPTGYNSNLAFVDLSVFIHEARHIVYGGHKCYGDFNRKDQNLAQLGPFAAEYYLATNTSTNRAFNSTEQAFIANQAKQLLQLEFCDPQS